MPVEDLIVARSGTKSELDSLASGSKLELGEFGFVIDTNELVIGKGDSEEPVTIGGLKKIGTAWVGGDDSGNDRGDKSLDLQSTRTSPNQVAASHKAICVGADNEANESFGVGVFCFGIGNKATGIGSGGFGFGCIVEGDVAFAYGGNVRILPSSGSAVEIGTWSEQGIRRGGVKMNQTGMVALTFQERTSAYSDGGEIDGDEASNELGRGMISFRVSGNDLVCDRNVDGTISSAVVGTFA
jgi:hypothetical protein